MQDLLLDFINGTVGERRLNRDSEYGEYEQKYKALYNHIKNQLPDAAWSKLDELESTHAKWLSLTDDRWMLAAFKLGALLMIEIYSGRDNTLSD